MMRGAVPLLCLLTFLGCNQSRYPSYAQARPVERDLLGSYRITKDSIAVAARALGTRPPDSAALALFANRTFAARDFPLILGWGTPVNRQIVSVRGTWHLKHEPDGWTIIFTTTRQLGLDDTAGVTTDRQMFIGNLQPPYDLRIHVSADDELVFKHAR